MKTGIRERWSEVRALFEAALDVPRSERDAFVGSRSPDSVLREAVLALLASEDAAQAGEPTRLVGRALPEAAEIAPGEMLGLYRVLRVLGSGGMGVVYLAQQLQPRREVAIKLISGRLDEQTFGRFLREADLLARLSHPGIAQIIELAIDGSGRPFLVMEYVDGQSLAEYTRELSRTGRLQLLARISDAVDHAHGRGIVHRDLKPSNILVGADGQPKILDFGIGFLSGSDHQSLTATGMVLGTPAYMSPEQAHGRSDIDARADVYALGAIGYELLTDRLPLPVSGLSPLQALRMVGHDTPAPLSRIDATLRGDLDIIFGKAMSKETSLRYANAGSFADDLRRFLHNEPIHARRPGWPRRVLLFARRNPLAVALSGTAIASLMAGLSVSLWFAWSEGIERARAVAEAQRAETALAQSRATLSALGQVFSAGNPVVAGRPEVTFREVLASAAAQIAQVPAATRAHVLFALAEAQRNLGDLPAAAGGFDEVQRLALEAGDERLYLRAGLRRVTQMASQESPLLAHQRIEELLARPGLHSDPLIEAALQVRASDVAVTLGRFRTAANSFEKARSLFPARVADDDLALRNEVEAELLFQQAYRIARDSGDAAAVHAIAAELRQTHERLVGSMGAEHPLLLQLLIGADHLESLFSESPEWARRVVRELDARIGKLGPAHPAILARLDAVALTRISDVEVERRLRQITAESMRALPLTSRWRGRVATNYVRGGWLTGEGFVTAEELLAMADTQCPPGAPVDIDCVRLRIAAATRMMEKKQRDPAIELLRAQLRVAQHGKDPNMLRIVNWELAMALRRSQRFDEAAQMADAGIAAILVDPELDEAARDRMVLETAFTYRPHYCERVLQHVLPRESRLNSYSVVARDVVARMLSTCEVRVGRDVQAALARLDRIWKETETEEGFTKRGELVLAYLEIHDLIGSVDEFARWAAELDRLAQEGLPIEPIANPRFPGVERALALIRKPK